MSTVTRHKTKDLLEWDFFASYDRHNLGSLRSTSRQKCTRKSPCQFSRGLTLEFNSDGRAGVVRFRSIPTPTPTGRSYVGGMVVQGVSKDCIFYEEFRNVFKYAVGAVAYELR